MLSVPGRLGNFKVGFFTKVGPGTSVSPNPSLEGPFRNNIANDLRSGLRGATGPTPPIDISEGTAEFRPQDSPKKPKISDRVRGDLELFTSPGPIVSHRRCGLSRLRKLRAQRRGAAASDRSLPSLLEHATLLLPTRTSSPWGSLTRAQADSSPPADSPRSLTAYPDDSMEGLAFHAPSDLDSDASSDEGSGAVLFCSLGSAGVSAPGNALCEARRVLASPGSGLKPMTWTHTRTRQTLRSDLGAGSRGYPARVDEGGRPGASDVRREGRSEFRFGMLAHCSDLERNLCH